VRVGKGLSTLWGGESESVRRGKKGLEEEGNEAARDFRYEKFSMQEGIRASSEGRLQKRGRDAKSGGGKGR